MSNSDGVRHQTKSEIERGEQKPVALPVNPDGIPEELKAIPQSVCWSYDRLAFQVFFCLGLTWLFRSRVPAAANVWRSRPITSAARCSSRNVGSSRKYPR